MLRDASSPSFAQVIGKFLYSFAEAAGVKPAKVDADLLMQTILRHEKQGVTVSVRWCV